MTKASILKILNYEIDYLSTKGRNIGFSRWAAYIAGAGLLWAFLQWVESNQPSSALLLISVITSLVAYRLLAAMGKFLKKENDHLSSNNRFFNYYLYSRSQPSLIWHATCSLLIIFSLYYLNLLEHFLATLFLSIVLFMDTLTIIAMYLILKTNFPLSLNNNNRYYDMVISVVYIGVHSIILFFILDAHWESLSEIQYIYGLGIVFALVFVANLYFRELSGNDVLLERFIQIRRELLMDKLDPKQSYQFIDLMIYGSSLPYLLQKEIVKFSELYENLNNSCSLIELEIKKIRTMKKSNKEDRMESLQKIKIQLQNIYRIHNKQILYQAEMLRSKMQLLLRNDHNNEKEISSFLENFNSLVSNFGKRIDTFKKILNDLEKNEL